MYRENLFAPQMQHLVDGGYKCGHVWIPVCTDPDGTRSRGCPVCKRERNKGKGAERGLIQDFHEAEKERQFQSLSITANRINKSEAKEGI